MFWWLQKTELKNCFQPTYHAYRPHKWLGACGPFPKSALFISRVLLPHKHMKNVFAIIFYYKTGYFLNYKENVF